MKQPLINPDKKNNKNFDICLFLSIIVFDISVFYQNKRTKKMLKGILDYSLLKVIAPGIKQEVDLSGQDFSEVVGIICGDIKKMNLANAKGLRGVFDFSKLECLDLFNADLRYSVIKLNSSADIINLSNDQGTGLCLSGQVCFGKVKSLFAHWMDFSNADVHFNRRANDICLSYAKGLHGKLDFSGVQYTNLSYADLSKVKSLELNPCAQSIYFGGQTMNGLYDFGGVVRELNLSGSNFSNAHILFNGNTKVIDVSNTKGLRGMLDFSGAEYLNFTGADLSRVLDVKVKNDAKIIGLTERAGFRGKVVVDKPTIIPGLFPRDKGKQRG